MNHLLRICLPLLTCLLLAPVQAAEGEATPPPDPWTFERPLSPDVIEALEYALSAQGYTLHDLTFDKSPVPDAFRLPEVQRTLDDPLSTYDITWDYARAFDSEDPLLPFYWPGWTTWEGQPTGVPGIVWPTPRVQNDVRPISQRLDGLHRASLALWADCAHRDLLLERLPSLLAEDEPAEGPPGYTNFPDYVRAEWLRIRSLEEGNTWKWYVQEAISVAAWARETAALPIDPDHVSFAGGIEVPEGMRWITGFTGDDTYLVQPGDVIIDAGGNDTYIFEDAAAPGALNHCIIDFSGDDRFLGTVPGAAGGGYLSSGIVVDRAGDDFYRTGPVSQGAGVFGVGVLIDESGTDTYQATDFVQGAGMCGIGLHWDGGPGNDTYRATLYGQGAALTGGLGICINREGDEVYYAGGAHQDFPRWPEHTLSLSQGCAFGMRPDASGGIAFLGDYAGNDIYTCEVYGQGVGYWYALGMLFDREGHDWYQLHQYGQGTGIHLASGCLIDASGIDRYNAWALAQGTGHDYGVGCWLDMEGHDFMLGNDICQGIGHFNSVGLAIDLAGDDFWGGRTLTNNQGWVNPFRDYGGIGVLLDMKGQDNYNIPGHADGLLWTEPNGGVGYDLDAPGAVGPLLWHRKTRMGGASE